MLNINRKVAISIEEGSTKVVYATQKRGTTWVEEMFTISSEEIEEFLRTERTKSFYINIHFPELLQETFLLPLSSDRHLKTLIQRELKAQYSDVDDWLFCYFIIGEKIEDNKRLLETLVFAIPKNSIDRYIQLFLSYGKMVDSLVPNYLPLLNLIPWMQTPALYMYRKASERAILLCCKGEIYLLRRLTGDPCCIDNTDIQNLNMTVNYARQRLGMVPETIYLIGQQDVSQELTIMPVVPLSTLVNPAIKLSPSVQAAEFNEYILPIAMTLRNRGSFLSKGTQGKTENWQKRFIPPDYRFYRGAKNYLSGAIFAMSIIGIFLIGILPFQYNELNNIKKSVNTLRSEVSDIKTIDRRYTAEFQRWKIYENKIQMLQLLNRELSPEEFLIQLSKAVSKDTVIDSVRINRSKESIEFNIKGRVAGADLLQRQRNYRRFIESLKGVNGILIVNESLRLEEGLFTVKGSLKGMKRI